MTKNFVKILILLALTSLFSCKSLFQQELEKSAKASAASSRINAGDNNSKDLLKELDE